MLKNQDVYDVIIIGAGPAGLTAGLYTARAALKTLIVESSLVTNQVVITHFVENYPGFPSGVSGPELMMNMRKQVEQFDVEFAFAHIKEIKECKQDGKKIFSLMSDDKEIFCKALIIATGAYPRKLEVPGEEEFSGRGVSYCATCDGAFFKNKHVVVVGGGDTAVEEAVFLTRFASKVTVIHRRDELRASKLLQERAFANDKVNFILSSQVVKIYGDKKVEGVNVLDKKTGKTSELACDGVFMFVGYLPNAGFLGSLLEKDELGYIIADSKMRTSKKGVFACGDCISKFMRQIVTACGDGACAAFSAQHYLDK